MQIALLTFIYVYWIGVFCYIIFPILADKTCIFGHKFKHSFYHYKTHRKTDPNHKMYETRITAHCTKCGHTKTLNNGYGFDGWITEENYNP